MTHRATICAALALAALTSTGSCKGAGLAYLGTLGQSQPASAPAAPFLSAEGVEADGSGNLWTGSGRTLYEYRPDPSSGGVNLVRTVDLPGYIVGGAIRSNDGTTVYAACSDGSLYSIDATAPDSKPTLFSKLPSGTRRFAITPAYAKGSFASMAPAFALTGDAVIACGGARDHQIVLQLHLPPAPADWGFESISIEPQTGDLLIGSGYPDMKVYRYAVDGSEVTTDGWPRALFALQIEPVHGVAWALKAGAGALSLPAQLPPSGEPPSFDTTWAHIPEGITPAIGPDGGYWIASTQGITHYDSFGQPSDERIGGLPPIGNLAVSRDGTVLAATDNGTRLLRLLLDDLPNAPLQCNGNSPWSPGGRDGDVCAGMVSSGKQFLVADQTAKQLFVFDPNKTDGGDIAWTKIETGTPLQAPRAIAGGEQRIWVLDGDHCLDGPIGPTNQLTKTDLPGMNSMAAITQIAVNPSETILFTSDGATITAFKRLLDGTYAKLWQAAGSNITSLAATETELYATQKEDSGLLKVNIATGVAQSVALDVPGGAKQVIPMSVAADGPYLLVADAAGYRLLLYHT